MKFRSYNEEIKTATAQFLDLFNDIVIDRRDRNGVQKLIKVPCVYGDRSRILKSLENRNKTLKIPLISVTKQGFARDTARISDLHIGMTYQIGDSKYDLLKDKPQPVDISFTVDIVTKYEEDMDQIVSNFMPLMRPDVYVVWPNPKQVGKHLKSQVIWDGSIDFERPEDLSETDPYRIIGTATFIYKTWLFTGLYEDDNDGPLIHKINFCSNLLSIADGNYMLDRWFDVPMTMSIDSYLDMVTSGLIQKDRTRDNWDYVPCAPEVSGNYENLTEALSGCNK